MKRLALTLLVACAALSSCAVAPPGSQTQTAPPASAKPACAFRAGGTPARPVDPPDVAGLPTTGTVTATLDLSGTPIRIDLDRAATPCAVASFESLARQGWFDKTSCHRLSTTGIFILQCGDPSGTGSGGPGYTFDDELTGAETYPAGTVAMANAGADTNGGQFFLVFADSPLPAKYTVLGRMDAASTTAVGALAFQGHDSSFPDGTGRPNAPATIGSVAFG